MIPEYFDYKQNVPKLFNLPKHEEHSNVEEQKEWTDVIPKNMTKRLRRHQYAHMPPMTDSEIKTAKMEGLFSKFEKEDIKSTVVKERLFGRYCSINTSKEKSLVKFVPQSALLLQSMLVCSLDHTNFEDTDLNYVQQLLNRYWTSYLTIFPRCVLEIRASTCKEITKYRSFIKKIDRNTTQKTPLIPIHDVNHMEYQFYKYPDISEVFNTIFPEQHLFDEFNEEERKIIDGRKTKYKEKTGKLGNNDQISPKQLTKKEAKLSQGSNGDETESDDSEQDEKNDIRGLEQNENFPHESGNGQNQQELRELEKDQNKQGGQQQKQANDKGKDVNQKQVGEANTTSKKIESIFSEPEQSSITDQKKTPDETTTNKKKTLNLMGTLDDDEDDVFDLTKNPVFFRQGQNHASLSALAGIDVDPAVNTTKSSAASLIQELEEAVLEDELIFPNM